MQSQTNDHPAVQAVAEASAYWIPQEKLGVLEGEALDLCFRIGQTKRELQGRFRNLGRALKLLKMVPAKETILKMGLGCDSNGRRGLYISCVAAVKVIEQAPEPQTLPSVGRGI